MTLNCELRSGASAAAVAMRVLPLTVIALTVPQVGQRDKRAGRGWQAVVHHWPLDAPAEEPMAMSGSAAIDWNARYRALPDWADVSAHHAARAVDIPTDATLASLTREKASHRGISARRSLTTLFASAVDQDYLDEICSLEALEYLWLGWPVTAKDLSGLARLKRLRVLKLDSPRNVTDFAPLAALPAIERLFVENAKHMTSLDWLAPLGERLAVLGIEGSMWTMQKVPSLAPLAGFAFEALF